MNKLTTPTLALIIMILLSVAAVSLTALLNYSRQKQIEYFQVTLQNASVTEKVMLATGVFHVHGAKVQHETRAVTPQEELLALRLTYAKVQAKRSPLFALAGTDIDSFLNALTTLENTQKRLAEIQDTRVERFFVGHNLYPKLFLKAVAQAEQARRNFIQSGSLADARSYYRALDEVPRLHQRDMFLYQRAYEYVMPDQVPTYLTERYAITKENFLRTQHELAVRTLQNTTKSQEKCFKGNIGLCDANSLAVPALAEKERAVPIPTYTALAKDFYNRLTVLRPTTLFALADESHVELSESSCLSSEILPLFAIRAESYSSGIFELSDIRFLEVEDFSNVPFFSFFEDQNLEYTPVSPLHHYTCVAMDFDIGRVYAVHALAAYAKANPVSQYIPELLKIEQKLSQETIVEKDAYMYVNKALEQVSALPADVSDSLIDLALQLQNASSNMEFLMKGISATEERNINLWTAGAPVNIESEHLFYSRSGLVSLSMQGNQSFGTEVNLFDSADTFQRAAPYIYLSEIVKKGTPLQKVVDDTYSYNLFHE